MSNGDHSHDGEGPAGPTSWRRIIANLVKALADSQRAKRDFQSAENRAANWTARATVVIAVFTAVAAGVGIAQWCIQRGTLDEMQSERLVMQGQLTQMQNDRRPWVSVDVKIDSVTWGKDGAQIVIVYQLKNTGRSPAMHVLLGEDVLTWVGADPKRTPLGWISDMLAGTKAKQAEPPLYGFPIFAGETKTVIAVHSFTRSDVEKFRQFLVSTKHSISDPDQPPLKDSELRLPLDVAYTIDYGFDMGATRHQTYCWASFGRTDHTDDLAGWRLVVPINVNLMSSQLGLSYGNIFCGAN